MATRASRPSIGLVIITTLSLVLSLAGYVRPEIAAAATATVDGRVTASDGYSKFADIFTEGEEVATVWWTRDATYVYFALELNALGPFVVNENVYAPGPNSDYHEADAFNTGWNNHNFGHLLNSDAARFQLACGGDVKHDFIQDYLYQSGSAYLSGPASDGSVIENGPALSSSSMVWNSTLGYADFATQSPDFDPAYPTPDDGDVPAGWVWEMTYEFAVAAAPYDGCSTTFAMPAFPGSNTLGGMHNSPSKFGGDSIIVPPIPEPSVSIHKTPDNGTVNAGDPIEFTITVSNGTDAGDAEGLVIDDHLPAGFDWTADQAACSITAHETHEDLHCDVPTLVGGASFTVKVSATTGGENDPCGLIENTATVSGGGIVAKEDSGSVTVDCPLIRIEKTPDEEAQNPGANDVEIGDPITFLLTVYNDGAGTASGVTVFDDLPGSGWQVLDAETSLAGCDVETAAHPTEGDIGEWLSCGPDSVASGAPKHVTVSRTAVYPSDCGEINNTAWVKTTNDGVDDDDGNIDVLCAAVAVEKTPEDGSVDAGGLATFTIRTKNTGSAPALGVTLDDALPATANGWSILTNWTADEATDCDLVGLELTCGPITLAAGAYIDVQVQARTTAEDCGPLNNEKAEARTTNDGSAWDSGLITVLCPDLTTEKSASAASVLAPGSLTYMITVTNEGDGLAEDVVVTDDLHDDLVITSATFGADGTCTLDHVPEPNSVSCSVGDLAKDESVTVTIEVTVPAKACGPIRNVATSAASNESAEAALNNPSGPVSVDVDCPDVSVSKTATEAQIVAGGTASFTIIVDGGEHGTTSDVILTDELPLAPSPWTIGGADAGDCTVDAATIVNPVAGGTEIVCNFGSFGPDHDTRTITLSAETMPVNCEAKIRNDATVEADGDTNLENNSDWAEVEVLCPDVEITKEAGDPVNAGEKATFTITVKAQGTGTSENVTVEDVLLVGEASDWSVDHEDCSIVAGPELYCELGDMQPDDEVVITLSYQTDADDCGVVPNQASVLSGSDTNPDNNESDRVSVEVLCPDLKLTKQGSEPISAGEKVSFTITVENKGEGEATGIELTDNLPGDGLGAWSIADTVGIDETDCDITEDVLTCTVAMLAAGASFSVTVEAETDSGACPSVENDASVLAGNEPAQDVYSNTDSAQATVNCPDLKIDKEPVESPISAGEGAEFTIKVWNTGLGTAFDLTVTDTAPEGTVWTVLGADGFACDDDIVGVQQTLTCELAELAPGEENARTIRIGYETSRDDCGVLTNAVVVVASNEHASNTEDNSDNADLVVECPGLNLVKIADADPIDAGETASYTITVWNTGPGTAFDVLVEDEIPAGWSFDDGGACDELASSAEAGAETEGWSCTIHALDVSEMEGGIQIVVSGPTTREDCGLLTNTAFASASNGDAELDSTDTIQVKCPTLVLEKEADAEQIVISGPNDDLEADPAVVAWTLSYTLADGPVTNAVISDELPIGLVYVDGSASDGGVYDEATNTLTWTFATLSQSGSVTYETEVDPETISRAAPTLNVAVISSDQTPEDEGEDQVTVVVEPPPLGGNPTPTPTPKPKLPDTAMGIGIGGEPITVPVELLVALFLGSLGAMALANVRAARERRR